MHGSGRARCVIRGLLALLLATIAPYLSADETALAFAESPEFALARMAPDGERLSYVSHQEDEQALIIRTLANGAEWRALAFVAVRERFRWCAWPGPTHLLCGTVGPLRRPHGFGEQTRLYSIAIEGRVRQLQQSSADPVRDQVIDFDDSHPTRVLIQHDAEGRGYPEVFAVDAADGRARRQVRAQPPVRRWLSDGAGHVRIGVSYDEAGSTLYAPGASEGEWRIFLRQPTGLDVVAPLAVGIHDQLYVLKHHQGRAALFQLALKDSAPVPKLLFAHPQYDVSGPVTLSASSGALLSVQYVGEQEMVHALDPAEAELRTFLEQRWPGRINVVIDRTADNRRLLVRSYSDVHPPSLYLVDRRRGSIILIGSEYPQLASRTLAPMRSIVYHARDGQRIPAYLTLAHGGSGRVPAIILPHGGPEARDFRAFDPLVQFLAAEGYAVLQMNYRGSLGYGARFAAAGAGQWGGVIHNDITDGARWLIEEGVADPERICIVGASFGGYAALLGAARESQWYACAVSYAGVSDLLALAQYGERMLDADVWRRRLGSSARAQWHASPLARAGGVETPVMLMHGRYDPLAPVSQSRRFARALRSANKPHRYFERADCDHGMTLESCRRAFFSELQPFLRRALASPH